MLTLYALVDPTNTKNRAFFNNTVVLIDPCLNPDGRDRYVNWFNTMVGKDYNVQAQSREHSEPWPGGRSNHYYFDLNRDWAWQTQKETQHRLAKYNEWMPQVHVDFHEQSYNDPYYFAPAAEPFHEVITPFQREFQNTIGRNHAKYFDANGWLYFTKERFDLFYPSYGDTYPTYNGAIGMTYEQGGGGRGGLGVIINNGDTLTLVDRVNHHFTTGISTVEITSQNANKVVAEFKKFFDDSKAGKGNVSKTYLVTTDNRDKINAVSDLLRKNGIRFGTIANQTFSGFNYRTNKEEVGKLKKYHLAISTAQPRSVMAKVLLEPSSNLSDSNTYDITAWSLPFAHDVDAYSTKQVFNITNVDSIIEKRNVPASAYGYLINYQSYEGAKLLAQLLKNKTKVRFSEKPFTYKGKLYDRGTLIVLTNNNPNLQANLNKWTVNSFAQIDAIETGFMDKGPDVGSADMRFIKAPKVALITGEQTSALGSGEVWHFFEQSLDYPITLINAVDLGKLDMKAFDVVILPDGNYKNLNERTVSDRMHEFVRSGGKIIALQNAVQQLASGDWELKKKENKPIDKSDSLVVRAYGNRERDQLTESIPGAIYKVDLDNTHPLAFGYPQSYYTLKQDADTYQYLKEGWNVGVIKKNSHVSGFVGSDVKKSLKDAMLFGVQELGSGNVVYLTDDPLFRQFWENGKLLFANAVFFVGQ